MESKMYLPRTKVLEEPVPSPSPMTPEGCLKQTSIAWWLEAEKCKKEDAVQREKITAGNSLESYVYSVKQTAVDPDVENKLNSADLETVKDRR